MKKNLHRLLLVMLGIAFVLGATGCATPALWSKKNRIGSFKPSPKPNLVLFHSDLRGDVLVLYDEQIDKKSGVKRRAYYLFENKDIIQKGSAPNFVSPQETNSLAVIPILPDEGVAEDQLRDLFAVTSDSPHQVTLYYDGGCVGTYALPAYQGTTHKWARIAVTPLAVGADGALILAAAIAMAPFAMVFDHSGGLHWHH